MANPAYTEQFRSQYDALVESLVHHSPRWLAEMRKEALERFLMTGFPSSREEAWKYTDLRALETAPFNPAQPEPKPVMADRITGLLPQMDSYWLVLLNGYPMPILSSLPEGNDKVLITPLSLLREDEEALVRPHLDSEILRNQPLANLNLAFAQEGLTVIVLQGKALDKPLHLVHLITDTTEQPVHHIRHMILAKPGSAASIIETYTSLSDKQVAWNNIVSQVLAMQDSTLNHTVLQLENCHTIHTLTSAVEVQRSAHYNHTLVQLGGELSRASIHAELTGERAEAHFSGLYLPEESQSMDTYLPVTHKAPHTFSRQHYRGVMADDAIGSFYGRIAIGGDAPHSEAHQQNRNLLLSESATANTRPELDISIDEVQCSHGATVGQLDDDALYYLQARGIGREEAAAMLVSGFVTEVVDGIPKDSLRDYVQLLLHHRRGIV